MTKLWTNERSDWFEPSTWPLGWRRLFLITSPVSVPLYIGGTIVFFFAIIVPVALISVFGGYVLDAAAELWRKNEQN